MKSPHCLAFLCDLAFTSSFCLEGPAARPPSLGPLLSVLCVLPTTILQVGLISPERLSYLISAVGFYLNPLSLEVMSPETAGAHQA